MSHRNSDLKVFKYKYIFYINVFQCVSIYIYIHLFTLFTSDFRGAILVKLLSLVVKVVVVVTIVVVVFLCILSVTITMTVIITISILIIHIIKDQKSTETVDLFES